MYLTFLECDRNGRPVPLLCQRYCGEGRSPRRTVAVGSENWLLDTEDRRLNFLGGPPCNAVRVDHGPMAMEKHNSFRWPWRRGPPLTIPNREVKTVCADGTAIPSGRVGSRLFSRDPYSNVRVPFFMPVHQNPILPSSLFTIFKGNPELQCRKSLS